jgi:hypothetical protein
MQGQDRRPDANRTGLPDNIRSGVEALSGASMDSVRAPGPAAGNGGNPLLSALAYTQGSDIHVGPGQETALPHEAWHVVQQ